MFSCHHLILYRTFRLFDFLDIKEDGSKCPRLIPYYMEDDYDVCPTYFNDERRFGKVVFDEEQPDDDTYGDPYRVNKWLPPNDPDRIDEK